MPPRDPFTKVVDDEPVANRWLLDGFPRTQEQASAIKDAGASPTAVLLIDVPDDVLVVRAHPAPKQPLACRSIFSPVCRRESASTEESTRTVAQSTTPLTCLRASTPPLWCSARMIRRIACGPGWTHLPRSGMRFAEFSATLSTQSMATSASKPACASLLLSSVFNCGCGCRMGAGRKRTCSRKRAR